MHHGVQVKEGDWVLATELSLLGLVACTFVAYRGIFRVLKFLNSSFIQPKQNESPIPHFPFPAPSRHVFLVLERDLCALSLFCFHSSTQQALLRSLHYVVCGKCAISSLSGHLFPRLLSSVHLSLSSDL